MEYLVGLRIVSEIYLTRLPVGHTHEDIDAMFGTMWVYFRLKPCLTLDAYKQGILECYQGDRKVEGVDVEDVYVVPNYVSFLSPHYDRWDRWAKDQLTVHQIHLYSCHPSVYFPLGYGLRYRDYASDKVVELKPVDKKSAVTMIGVLTGIEPVTHHVKWFPDEFTYENRPVEGFFKLRIIPYSSEEGISPINFFEDDISNLEAIQQGIVSSKLFPSGSKDRDSWMNWFQWVLPKGRSLLGKDYVLDHEYKQPLKHFLSGKLTNYISDTVVNNICLRKVQSDKDSVEWPKDIISFATPHVNVRAWKNLVIPPRQYQYLSEYVQHLTKSFQDATNKYYESRSHLLTIENLQTILCRRLNTQGKHEALNGDKQALIARVFTGDYEIFTNFYHPIRDSSKRNLVRAYWLDGKPVTPQDAEELAMVAVDRQSRAYELCRDLHAAEVTHKISSNTFMKILSLLRNRDALKVKAFQEFYPKEASRKYLKSIFLSPSFATNFFILNDFQEADLTTTIDLSGNSIFRVYIPVRSEDSLVVLNVIDKEFWYFNADASVTFIDEAKRKGER
jgi:hypothetical protein